MTTTDSDTRATDEDRPTDSIYDHHPFNFGIWRHTDPVDDANADAEAAEATSTEGERPVVTDGGVAATTVCPSCSGELVNVQGVPACSDCTWTAR
ncbi:hypothetical protein [Haloarchaeobius sp. HRN-SO-5]|uniref:hypothetical protein n=1 Tax=Haloarchaeobius sp. HRN-SO-5 TaxID=3446118 RepID=UPI003EBA790E